MTHLIVSTFTCISAPPGWPIHVTEKKKEKKKQGEEDILSKPIYVLDATASSIAAFPLCELKRVVDHMPTTGHVQKPCKGHGQVMHAMWAQAVVIIKTM